jgi:hypothetical protein
MAKYVLRHGGLGVSVKEKFGDKDIVRTVHLRPSTDPLKPTLVEMSEAEAAKINGHQWDADAKKHVARPAQLLPNATDDGSALQPLAEYEAEQAAEKAKAEVLAKHRAEAKPKGGGK